MRALRVSAAQGQPMSSEDAIIEVYIKARLHPICYALGIGSKVGSHPAAEPI